MSVRTVHLQLNATQPAASINVWPVRVRGTVFLGDLTQVHVKWGGRELVVRQTSSEAPAGGSTAFLFTVLPGWFFPKPAVGRGRGRGPGSDRPADRVACAAMALLPAHDVSPVGLRPANRLHSHQFERESQKATRSSSQLLFS